MRWLYAALFLTALACTDQPPDGNGPPSGCTNEEVCSGGQVVAAGPASGAGGSTAATGAGGAGLPIDHVYGTVALLFGSTFSSAADYDGTATIEGVSPEGSAVSTVYDASVSSQYDLENVASGDTWLFASDPVSLTADAMSTFNPVSLAAGASATADLVVVDRPTMVDVAAQLGGALPGATSHFVIFVGRADVPLAGVSVDGDVGGAIVGYDVAAGTYSSSATSTGADGIVLLIGATPPSSGAFPLTLVDDAANAYGLILPASSDAVTLIGIALE